MVEVKDVRKRNGLVWFKSKANNEQILKNKT